MSQALRAVSPKTRDAHAPACLLLTITDEAGNVWGMAQLDAKAFSTGSVGYYGNAKIKNPKNADAKYQSGFTLTLIGSK